MFFPLIEKRRSIRKFKPVPVEGEKVELLIEAALRAPSSRGFNPWRFIVIDDPELLTRISEAKPHGASFLKGAALGIVVCGDSKKSDVWVEDTSIASTYIQLAAQELGLGSCWIQMRKREHDDSLSAEAYIKALLDVPEHVKIESVIALGYPDEQKAPHAKDSLDYDKVFHNKYGSKR